ncbi:MAG: hypothetical protein R3C05_02120 [Pirellulaceae bacterium]
MRFRAVKLDSGRCLGLWTVCPNEQPWDQRPTFRRKTPVPTAITPDLAPTAYAPNNNGYRPIIALGSPYPNVQVGRGIIGQPTVYVPGQPIRNFFRYLSP